MNNTEYSTEQLMGMVYKNKKSILAVGIIIVFTLVASSIIHKVQAKKIETLNSRKEMESKKNDILREIGRSEKTIKLYKSIFGDKDVSSITGMINSMAKGSSVTLISIQPGSEEKQPFYSKSSYLLMIGANNYHAIGKFISKIESEPDIYFIDKISIGVQEGKAGRSGEAGIAANPAYKFTVNLILSVITFKG